MMNSNATNELADSTNYDYTGATIYIVIVLLWYSIGIIFMLGMQMRARSETIEESARRRTKILIRSLRNNSNTKEILGKSNLFAALFRCFFSLVSRRISR